jgi:predicted RecB family nuclease
MRKRIQSKSARAKIESTFIDIDDEFGAEVIPFEHGYEAVVIAESDARERAANAYCRVCEYLDNCEKRDNECDQLDLFLRRYDAIP